MQIILNILGLLINTDIFKKNLNKSNDLSFEIYRLLLLFILTVYPLIFLSEDSNSKISFLKTKHQYFFEQEDYFWYLKFFDQHHFSQSSGKEIQVVIIDGDTNQKVTSCNNGAALSMKSTKEDEKKIVDTINQKNKKLRLYLMQKKLNLKTIIEKYHADITSNLIMQIAPQAKISVIPILNEHAGGSKIDLYKALKKALQINPDVLHLGLQVIDFNPDLNLDKKILKTLKKFKCVVAPVGNNGLFNESVGFPANCPFVISVASFIKKEGDRFPISDFCQVNSVKADFIMPGENLLAQIWIEELQDHFFIPVSGTSMAAALATGQIVRLLEQEIKQNKTIHLLKKRLQKHSVFLENSWKKNIRYGIPILKKGVYA